MGERDRVAGLSAPPGGADHRFGHAMDAQDRLWIAYDEAPENWGKDVGFLLSGGTGLYDSRTIKVAVYAGGRWMTPLRQPGAAEHQRCPHQLAAMRLDPVD